MHLEKLIGMLRSVESQSARISGNIGPHGIVKLAEGHEPAGPRLLRDGLKRRLFIAIVDARWDVSIARTNTLEFREDCGVQTFSSLLRKDSERGCRALGRQLGTIST